MANNVRHKKKSESEMVFEIRVGLNQELDDVMKILGKWPLPSKHRVFSEVRREEKCRGVILKEISTPNGSDGSTLGTHESHRPDSVKRMWGASTLRKTM